MSQGAVSTDFSFHLFPHFHAVYGNSFDGLGLKLSPDLWVAHQGRDLFCEPLLDFNGRLRWCGYALPPLKFSLG